MYSNSYCNFCGRKTFTEHLIKHKMRKVCESCYDVLSEMDRMSVKKVVVNRAFGGFWGKTQMEPYNLYLEEECDKVKLHSAMILWLSNEDNQNTMEYRSLPVVVATVERLLYEYPDTFGALSIVEVDGDAVNTYISENDGYETVREGRVW